MSIETTVRDILQNKHSSAIRSIGPEDMVFDALREMAIHNVGALLVMENDKIVGIVSERDYARKGILKNRFSRTTTVAEIMATRVMYVVPEDTAKGCMALMTEKHIRHLPVMEGDRLVGMVSIGDIVKAVIEDHEYMINQLTHYATGSYNNGFEASVMAAMTMAEERIL